MSTETPVEITPSPSKEKGRRNRGILLGIVAILLIIAIGVASLFFYLRSQETAWLSDGQAASTDGEYPEAILAFNQAMAIQPAWVRQHDAEAVAARGLAYLGDGNHRMALEDSTVALATTPDDSDLLLARAQTYMGLGDLQAAIDDLTRLLDLVPQRTDALALRAAAYLKLGDREACMSDCETAIAQDAIQAEPYLYRGLIHLHFRRDADALIDLSHAVELDDTPNDIRGRALVARGLVFLLTDDSATAGADAQAALALAPDSALAQALLGAASADGDDSARGLEMLNQAISSAPDDESLSLALYLRARAHLANAQTAAALSDAEQLVTLAPDWSWGYLLRGDVHVARNEGPQAHSDYQKAVDLDPKSGIVYAGRASGYLQAHNLDAAQADLATALSYLPDYVPAILLHAQVAAAAGDSDTALADLNDALVLAPTSVDAYALRAELHFQSERWIEARTDCDQVLAANPDDLAALSYRARASFALGDYTAAIADLDAAIASAPTDADLIALRAEAYLAVDNLDLAFRNAQRALALDDTLPMPQLIEGLVQLEQEHYFQAVVDLTTAIKLNPELARAYAARARAHFELNDPDRARTDAARALELDHESAQAYLARALVYVYERDWRNALADADRAVELTPDDEKVWIIRGRIYMEGGDANAALDNFEQALALHPDWVEGHLWRATALDDLQRYDDAVAALQSALEATADVSDVELAESSIADLQRIPPDVEGIRTWHDVYHDFTISYPVGWRQYVDPGEKVPLMLVGPLDKDHRANLLMTILELEFSLTPSQLAKVYGPSANTLLDYEMVSERTIRVDGFAAVRRVFTWTAIDNRLRDVPVTVVQVYAIVNKRAVVLTGTARTEGADKYEPIFDEIIASIDLG
jgi:tetratricopeptide (TPR) repeat protein